MSLDLLASVGAMVPVSKRQQGASVYWWALLGMGAATLVVSATLGRRVVSTKRINQRPEPDGEVKEGYGRETPGRPQRGRPEGPPHASVPACNLPCEDYRSLEGGSDQLFFSLLEAYAEYAGADR
mmetsp:Transcript_13881/g.29012  ORF Transcript_13881/g.29012 Transcript_13881/m.29012 type:complete len:125 (-) Transcript_13881:361-735(-)